MLCSPSKISAISGREKAAGGPAKLQEVAENAIGKRMCQISKCLITAYKIVLARL